MADSHESAPFFKTLRPKAAAFGRDLMEVEMDFLKELLGKELCAQIEAALAGREDVQLANVADGSYIPAEEAAEKDKQISDLTAKVEALINRPEEDRAKKPGKNAGEAKARQTEQGDGKGRTDARPCDAKEKAGAKDAAGQSKVQGAKVDAGKQNADAQKPNAKAGEAAANATDKAEAVKPDSGEGIGEELEQAINDELEYAGAKNLKAVRALIDAGELELSEDGEVVGLEEQIEALKKSDPYLFEEELDSRGVNPAGGGNPAAADSATRMNRLIRGAAGKQK